MKSRILGAAAVAAALVACGGGGARPEATSESAPEAAQAAPEVGKPAPSFELPGSDGAIYRLEDYRGKKAVVLAWFPKAFTGG